ncbi:DUF411 domain-containing protein [Herbaspirillum sp. LeCh32-8]|uniref:DUF411 domain-containing protein n=1 Tax=Herbaspirillum sp. LeCh32-8 TaxID=2821356 RepID=UPI001AE2DCCB|nr:DUF411 domain-containing protein [Herbaspirillum sp. LeCh32-8]MBP0600215.1 DUF411 domain-containing protein [Herbaspirillum sp. LeCh32-8]
MQRRHFTLAALAALTLPALTVLTARASGKPVERPRIAVYKDANCGCCHQWVAHLQASGFQVDATDVEDTGVWRRRFGMPDRFASCHSARVEGYAVEGHVPAAEILRLLKEKPAAVGLAVAGMPAGSPGMEDPRKPNARAAYDVLLVGRDGKTAVYHRYDAVAG